MSLASNSPRPTFIFSDYSSDPVPESVWASTEFLLAAGMVVIQPSMKKFLILESPSVQPEDALERWTLPHGRKHIGESLETAPVRIAREEVRLLILADRILANMLFRPDTVWILCPSIYLIDGLSPRADMRTSYTPQDSSLRPFPHH